MSTITSGSRSVALVTGGSRGIGKAIALRLADAGWFVVVNYLSQPETAEATLAQILDRGGHGAIYCADVTDRTACDRMFLDVAKQYGPVRLLVNNAGVTRDEMFMMMTAKSWSKVLDVNLNAVFNCCKAVTRSMIAKRAGVIINIGSGSGISPRAGQVNYSSSKSALLGFTRSLARELAPYNVRALVVAPGFTRTEMAESIPAAAAAESLRMIPMGRWGEPHEIAEAVCFLASDEAAYFTGGTVVVDGGRAGSEQDFGLA